MDRISPSPYPNVLQLPLGHASRSSTVLGRDAATSYADVNLEFEQEAYGPLEKPEDQFEVRMGPQDPDNPKSWSRAYRWYITALSAILLLNAYVVVSFHAT